MWYYIVIIPTSILLNERKRKKKTRTFLTIDVMIKKKKSLDYETARPLHFKEDDNHDLLMESASNVAS